MPPRRRKNFFKIRPRWEGRTESQKRLFINRLRLAFANYIVHIDYNDSREVNRQLQLRVRAAARDFLPQNNANGFFVDEMTRRFVDLIHREHREGSSSAIAFMRIAENYLDSYLGDSVTYYDNDTDDEF